MSLKVIAGINNFDQSRVEMVAEAAQRANVWALDIACDKTIVEVARNAYEGQLFVSAVEVDKLIEAIGWGVDGVELGNFDYLYETGVFLSAQDVMDLARDLVTRVNDQVKVSVTIPGHLAEEKQTEMARELSQMGVDFIQTEGSALVMSGLAEVKVLEASEKAELTFTNTTVIAGASTVPVMTASGLTHDNVHRAFKAGATCVGVGAAINTQKSVDAMVTEINRFQAAIVTARSGETMTPA